MKNNKKIAYLINSYELKNNKINRIIRLKLFKK